MSRYNTNNPVPSNQVKDFSDNAQIVDEIVHSTQTTTKDRFGRDLKTWRGIQDYANEAISQFGYITMDSFEDGNTLTLPNQALRYEATGEYYRWDGVFPSEGKIVPPGSTPESSGGIGVGAWIGIGDASLRSNLASQSIPGSSLVVNKQPFAGSVPVDINEKLKEIRSSVDFNSVGGDSVTRKAELDNAISSFGYSGNGSIYLDEGRHMVPSALNNPFGVEFHGPGVIGISDGNSSAGTPEIHQLNSYADKHKYCFGVEYLYAYYHATRTDNATPAGLLKCILAGDSTMHGGNGEQVDYKPEILITQLFRLSGVPNIGVFNRAVPSTSWGDMNIIGDLGASTRLLMIKYGINDAFGPKDTRHQNMVNAMRAKLQEIRSQPFGGLEWLSIILVGPNSTNDSLNMRNEEWYESIRGIYAEIAREFKCTYFDTYAFLRDSRAGAGLWLDEPPILPPGSAIHPLSEMNMEIYGRLFDEVFGYHMLMRASLNSKANLPLHVEAITPTTLPLDAPFIPNEVWHQAAVANGWDFTGRSESKKSADGLQTLTVYNQANSRIQHKSKPIGSNAWNKSTGKPYPLVLGNNWVDFGGSYNSASATLTLDGTIVLSGAIKSGTTGVGDAMFSLPTGFTPKGISRHVVSTNTTAAIGHIEIRQNGQAVIVSGISNTFVSLEGITLQLA